MSSQLLSKTMDEIMIDVREDDAVRMNRLIDVNIYECNCRYCQTFRDFTPMTFATKEELTEQMQVNAGSQLLREEEQFSCCNRLWAYYVIFMSRKATVNNSTRQGREVAFKGLLTTREERKIMDGNLRAAAIEFCPGSVSGGLASRNSH